MIREREIRSSNGWAMFFTLIPLIILALAGLIWSAANEYGPTIVACAFLIVVGVTLLPGFYIVNPNEGRVLQLFGEYKGTDRVQGFRPHPDGIIRLQGMRLAGG